MIILNTVNHENNKIEYHFNHDDFNGVVFKILASFDIYEENGEHYLGCNYEQLTHIFNDLSVPEDEIKRVCDEFTMGSLQTLLSAIKNNVNSNTAEIEHVDK